ncbi:hypothetical protein [Piscibacillus halophilus]|uniref:hypothetical protein n=1 Tax=Piscibacillus halophilus TaxID=571933 RepID=UPI00240A26DC|nr:hypothetical protein [Piscibacillus halophilus]
MIDNDWLHEVRSALEGLGGKAHLEDIYNELEKRNKVDFNSYVNWKSRVRKTIYLHSSDADIFEGTIGGKDDIFYAVRFKGDGYWGLRGFDPSE